VRRLWLLAAAALKVVGVVRARETAKAMEKDTTQKIHLQSPAAFSQVTDVILLLSQMKIVQRRYARSNIVFKVTERETI